MLPTTFGGGGRDMTFKSNLKAPDHGLGHYEAPELPSLTGLGAGFGGETFVKIWTVHGCPNI